MQRDKVVRSRGPRDASARAAVAGLGRRSWGNVGALGTYLTCTRCTLSIWGRADQQEASRDDLELAGEILTFENSSGQRWPQLQLQQRRRRRRRWNYQATTWWETGCFGHRRPTCQRPWLQSGAGDDNQYKRAMREEVLNPRFINGANADARGNLGAASEG